MRFTEQELVNLAQLKENLEFKSVRDLMLFCLDVTENLYHWNCSDRRFFVGNPKQEDYQEVEFEFKPRSGEIEAVSGDI
jgi:hypothetical protein